MNLVYDAVDKSGGRVRDHLNADSIPAGIEELRKQGLFVTHIAADKEGSSDASRSRKRFDPVRLSLTTKQLVLFTRQMAMLLRSGSALVPALSSIGKQMKTDEHRKMVDLLKKDLEDGKPLTEALRHFPRCFDAAYCAVVAAGESSATLPEMFSRLAEMAGKKRAIQNRVIGAMIYPCLLSCLSTGIMAVMMFFVVPRFTGMFKTLGVALPASTAVMMGASTALKKNWFMVVLLGLVLPVTIYVLVRTNRGRQFASNMQTRIPLAGRLCSRLIQAKTFRVMGMLLEARVGLLDAMDLARGVTRNDQYLAMYHRLDEAVTSGESVSGALEEGKLIDPSIIQAIRTGEQSGRLGEAISYVANVLDEDNAELLNTLTRLVEPLILIVMGGVVGTVAVSLFMPLFDMTAAM